MLTKLKTNKEWLWYAAKAIEHGWSRAILVMQIESCLYQRQGATQNNFANRLPASQSDLARETIKDPYLFDFLGLGEEAHERDIETALVQHLTQFLLKLHCYIVVELKATAFKPEYAGQLSVYLSALDADVKVKEDNPTIGLLLCKDHNRTVAEYALQGMDKPMGIANFQLLRVVPEKLVGNLPTIEAIEKALQWRQEKNDP